MTFHDDNHTPYQHGEPSLIEEKPKARRKPAPVEGQGDDWTNLPGFQPPDGVGTVASEPDTLLSKAVPVEYDIRADELVTVDAAPTVEDDPFSPENLALSQDFGGMTETKRLLTVVRVGKPRKEAFVRTSDKSENWIVGSVLELKDQGDETYWVTPKVRDALIGEPCLKAVRLILAVDRQGVPFLWKIAMPDPNGRSQPWVDSAIEAANRAKSEWVRMAWLNGMYETTVAPGIKAKPVWPSEPMKELLNIAFRGRVVSSLDHPIIRTLRGQD